MTNSEIKFLMIAAATNIKCHWIYPNNFNQPTSSTIQTQYVIAIGNWVWFYRWLFAPFNRGL